MILYISGPMTGYENYNYPAFHAAQEDLESVGYTVLSPANHPLRDDWEWVDYMEADIALAFQAEGFATLEGWEKSKGARIEVAIADSLGLPVRPLADWMADALAGT